MDYETGRADPRKLAIAVALSALGIIVILPLGATLAILCSDGAFNGGAWALLGHIVGWALGVLGLVVSAVPTGDYLLDGSLYRRRQRDAFKLEMKLREKAGGVVTVEKFEEWQFYAQRPNDMVLIIAALTRRAATDHHFRPSIGTLVEEGVWLGNRKLGDVNTNQARVILTSLAEMGFIVGRADGNAGEWAYTSVDEALTRYERKG
jgi:hypothetical protein